MEIRILQKIIKKKETKSEFSLITNLETGESIIFEHGLPINKSFHKYKDKINDFYKQKKNGIIKDTQIFVETFFPPIKVVIVGAVHIAQYLVNFAKTLNFEIIIIDPRGYFASERRFPNVDIINKWPQEALEKMKLNSNTAMIALTHDPKIDDPALQYALKNNFFYIGALGSKKTHANRLSRLNKLGFAHNKIEKIYGPIGIKLGGKSAPEIALSIIAQLVSEVYKK
jgi:xanthine dehydrogenase accessory factor